MGDTRLMDESSRKGTFRAVRPTRKEALVQGLLWLLLTFTLGSSVLLLLAMRKP